MGSALTFMMVYIWGRRNEFVRMNFLGLIPFTAPYLPWVLFGFSFLLGSSPTVDIIGIAVGHIYYYFDDVYPEVARLRGWPVKYFLRAPAFLTPIEDLEDTDITLAGMNMDQGNRLDDDGDRNHNADDTDDVPIVDAVRLESDANVNVYASDDVYLDRDQMDENQNVSGVEIAEEKQLSGADGTSDSASASPKDDSIDKVEKKMLSLRERMLAAAEARAEAKRVEEEQNKFTAEEEEDTEPQAEVEGFGLRQRKPIGESEE
mmetsp:Transcript_4543/g.5739  ORF Transcript_4543/g.5739 Transcript_4543/m.5739 type:complete len:261 (-) Transcript_4543:223-1005(-)